MPSTKKSLVRFTTFAVAALMGAGLVLAQEQQPEEPTQGKWELTDASRSWPHEVQYTGQPHDGKTAADLLREIHTKAVSELEGATPQKKAQLLTVMSATLDCLALDGNFGPDPAEAHHSTFGPVGNETWAHSGAKAKLLNAYNAAFPTTGPADWALVGTELQHGH